MERTVNYGEIANLQTCLRPKDVADKSCKGWHESLLRSYHIVEKVKYLLEANTSPAIVLELIALMQSNAFQPYGWHEMQYHIESGHAGDSVAACQKCRPETYQNAITDTEAL